MEQLAAVCVGSPLAKVAHEAVSAVLGGQFGERNFAIFATVRMGLMGAVHDALREQAFLALGLESEPGPYTDTVMSESPLATSCQHWLAELAIAGFRQVENEQLVPFLQTIDSLLETPALMRLTVMVNALYRELDSSLPIATMGSLPRQRWGDMWAQAFVTCLQSAAPEPTPVSGELRILGVDLPQHANVVQLRAYGLFDGRLVGLSIAAFKVDSIIEHEVWKLFAAEAKLLQALVEGRSLMLDSMLQLASGELLWDDAKATLGRAFDPLEAAATMSKMRPNVAAIDRHPTQLAIPVFLESCAFTAADLGFLVSCDFGTVPVDMPRLSPSLLIDDMVLKETSACFGLLRYDDGWCLQPLTVRTTLKKKAVILHNAASALGVPGVKKKASSKPQEPVEILQERASRLLRA